MENEKLVIEARFHGPPGSGNGGYVCGKLAGFLDDPCAVRLQQPPPLDQELTVRFDEHNAELHGAAGLIAVARSLRLELDPPESPPLAVAEQASERFVGFHTHPFPTCFVGGPERDPGDGLRIFPGSIDPGQVQPGVVACTWTPSSAEASAADPAVVGAEFVWAALDCPGAFAFQPSPGNWILLGELAASLRAPIPVGQPHIVVAWEIAQERRKHVTGTAIYAASGQCLAVARGTWIEVSELPGAAQAPST